MSSSTRIALLAVVGLAFVARAARADELPAKTKAQLLLRVLAYDHKLADRSPDGRTLSIVVVFKASSNDSESAADDMFAALRDLAGDTTVANMNVRVTRLAYSDKTFDADIGKGRWAAMYLSSALSDQLEAIVTVTRRRSILSFTGIEDYVDTRVSVGFVVQDGRPEILVNLPASRAEGAELDASLLRVARIVKR